MYFIYLYIMADEVQFLCYVNRQSGSAGCHPHRSCCSGAHPLHLLGCEKGLRLHLHVPLPVHLPQRAAGVPRHPGLPARRQRGLPILFLNRSIFLRATSLAYSVML